MIAWGETDGVHLVDRTTGNAVCDVRAGGAGTNKRGETSCSACLAALAERAAGDPGGYMLSMHLHTHPGAPAVTVGDRLPFKRDDGRALRPEIVAVGELVDGMVEVTLYSRDRLYVEAPSVGDGS